jgi:hypothetical protein
MQIKVFDFLKETLKPPTQSLSHLAAASRSSWRLSQSFWDLIVL